MRRNAEYITCKKYFASSIYIYIDIPYIPDLIRKQTEPIRDIKSVFLFELHVCDPATDDPIGWDCTQAKW